MSDLTRYLTDDELVDAMVPHVACCPGCPDPVDAADQRGMAVAALSAVLPDIIRQAKAEAWDEGHYMSELGLRHAYCQPNPYRADRIEHDARCPHPKCPGGGLCCCLSEQGGQP